MSSRSGLHCQFYQPRETISKQKEGNLRPLSNSCLYASLSWIEPSSDGLTMTTTVVANLSLGRNLTNKQQALLKAICPAEMTTLDQLRKYVICDLTTNTHTQPNQY